MLDMQENIWKQSFQYGPPQNPKSEIKTDLSSPLEELPYSLAYISYYNRLIMWNCLNGKLNQLAKANTPLTQS